MHEMAINGDSKIQRDFFVYYNVEQYKSLNIINVQTVRTNDVERTWQFLADAPMQLFSIDACCCLLIKIQQFKLALAFVNTQRRY